MLSGVRMNSKLNCLIIITIFFIVVISLFLFVFLVLILTAGISNLSSILKDYGSIIGSILTMVVAFTAIYYQSHYIQKQIASQQKIDRDRIRVESREKALKSLTRSYELLSLVKAHSLDSPEFRITYANILSNVSEVQVYWSAAYLEHTKLSTSLGHSLWMIYSLRCAEEKEEFVSRILGALDNVLKKNVTEDTKKLAVKCKSEILEASNQEGVNYSSLMIMYHNNFSGLYRIMLTVIGEDVQDTA